MHTQYSNALPDWSAHEMAWDKPSSSNLKREFVFLPVRVNDIYEKAWSPWLTISHPWWKNAAGYRPTRGSKGVGRLVWTNLKFQTITVTYQASFRFNSATHWASGLHYCLVTTDWVVSYSLLEASAVVYSLNRLLHWPPPLSIPITVSVTLSQCYRYTYWVTYC